MGGVRFSAAFIGPKNDVLDFLRAIALRPGQCHRKSENTGPFTAHEKIERASARATVEQEYRIAQDFENNLTLRETSPP